MTNMADESKRADGETTPDFDIGSLDDLFDEENAEPEEKSVWQLHFEAFELYIKSFYEEAAETFHQAAELAERQGNTEEQCWNLRWEGDCYRLNGQLRKALHCLLLAEELRGLNEIHQCYSSMTIFEVSSRIPLPLSSLLMLLERLKPYQTIRRIGGSKSMALIEEYQLLDDRGRDAQALARAQEAFVSQVDEAPSYNNQTYFMCLINACRVNGRLSDAWDTLRHWKSKGSLKFVDTKSLQIREEAKLLYTEGRLSDAWDTLLQCYREERIIGRAGREIATLCWLIQVGAELGYFHEILPYLRQILRFRNSESMFLRFYCREAFARYFLALCASGTLDAGELAQARRHVAFWLDGRGDCPGARTLARELDALLSVDGDVCDNWTRRVQELEQQYRSNTLPRFTEESIGRRPLAVQHCKST